MPALKTDIKKKHGFDSPEQEAWLNLARTHAAMTGPFVTLFKQHGLTPASYNVLRILRGVRQYPERGHEALPCAEIVERMVTRVPDLTRLIDRLVEKGLAERKRAEEDRRVVRVRITRRGSSLLKKLDGPVAQLHRRVMSGLSVAEVSHLNRLLEKARI
ncbi:MAG: MarR family transcriptional regulator [Planctomycetota bacterium]